MTTENSAPPLGELSLQETTQYHPEAPLAIASVEGPDQTIPQQDVIGPSSMPYPVAKLAPCEEVFFASTFTVDSTAAIGTGVSVFSPFMTWNYLTNGRHNPFRDVRCRGIEVILTPLSPMSTLRGCLRVSWTKQFEPTRRTTNTAIGYDLYRMSTVDSFLLPFSTADSTKFTVPFVYPRPFFVCSTSWDGNNGVPIPTGVYIGVEQPLASTSGGAVALEFQVYLRAIEPEYYCPSTFNVDVPAPPPVFTFSSHTPAYTDTTIGAYGGPKREAAEKSETGLISGIAKTVQKASSLVSSYDPTGISGIVGSVASAVGSVADFFGLDKPNCVEFAKYASLRLGDHLIQTEGLDPSVDANIRPDVYDTTDVGIFGDVSDPGNIQSIASQYSLHSVVTTDIAAVAGSMIWMTPVCPGYKKKATTVYAPLVSYASSFFAHWRGDLRYRITIHNDQFFSASLAIVYMPNLNQSPVASLTRSMMDKLRHTVVPISGSKVIEFTIPYHGLTEWDATNGFDPTSNHMIGLFLLAPARRSGVITNFTFSVEVAASQEPGRFEVAEPSSWSPPVAFGLLSNAKESTLGELGQTAIVPVPSMTPLLKRYVKIASPAPTANRTDVVRLSDLNFVYNWLSLYSFCRGPMRSTIYLPAGYSLRGTFQNFLDSTDPTFSTTGQQQGNLVKIEDYNPEVPYQLHYLGRLKFTLINDLTSHSWNYLYYNLVQPNGTVDPTTPLEIYHALGDEFIYGSRKPVPVLY